MKTAKKPIIYTEHLSLHPFSDGDRDNVIALLTNKEVIKTFIVPDFRSFDEAAKMFEILKQMSASEKHFVYGIYLEDELIGFINDVGISENEIELGYVISPERKNNGFATETLSAAISELFNIGFSTVKAGAFEENGASIRVMEKCGMLRTAQEEFIEYRGKKHRCVYYQTKNSHTP